MCGCDFPTTGARCSLPALAVIAAPEHPEPPSQFGLQASPQCQAAICIAGTAGQTEGRRTISLVLSSEEEDSREKCSDMPTLTQLVAALQNRCWQDQRSEAGPVNVTWGSQPKFIEKRGWQVAGVSCSARAGNQGAELKSIS